MVNRILSIVGWIGTGLVVVAVGIRFLYPAKEQWAYYLAWAGLVCVLAYSLSQWREITKVFSRRQARYGTLAATSILVVLGILVAINYIGAKQNKRWDLTANKQFSLADQSRNVLAKLDAPLQIQVFAQEPEFPRYQDKMKEYEYASKNITTEYVDPDKKPTVAKQNQIQQYGTIVFNYKGRTERVTSDTEQDITTGIIKVVTGQQKKVYFSQGHGEKDNGSAERDGYNGIAGALGRENYTVDKLVIAQQGAVPDDAAVVIVAGPRTDFFPQEVDALKTYLEQGRQAAARARSSGQTGQPPADESHRARARLGHGRRQRRRRGRERHGTLDRHRRVGSCGRELSVARHHAAVQLPDGLPAVAVGHRRQRGRRRTHRAGVHRNQPAKLGRNRHQSRWSPAVRWRWMNPRATRRARFRSPPPLRRP